MPSDVTALWDAEADGFDDEPDHGLRDPGVRAAWTGLLRDAVPPGSRVLDLGCGTGSLSVLLAELGHAVTGVDLSARMLGQAQRKAARHGVEVALVRGDAAAPPVRPGVDVVLVRHVVWALPDPSAALDRWLALLAPPGRLVLVEGRWGTGAGLSATALEALVAPKVTRTSVQPLTDPRLWGRAVTDERYLLLADGPPASSSPPPPAAAG